MHDFFIEDVNVTSKGQKYLIENLNTNKKRWIGEGKLLKKINSSYPILNSFFNLEHVDLMSKLSEITLVKSPLNKLELDIYAIEKSRYFDNQERRYYFDVCYYSVEIKKDFHAIFDGLSRFDLEQLIAKNSSKIDTIITTPDDLDKSIGYFSKYLSLYKNFIFGGHSQSQDGN